jgi:hypothetical protein
MNFEYYNKTIRNIKALKKEYLENCCKCSFDEELVYEDVLFTEKLNNTNKITYDFLHDISINKINSTNQNIYMLLLFIVLHMVYFDNDVIDYLYNILPTLNLTDKQIKAILKHKKYDYSDYEQNFK